MNYVKAILKATIFASVFNLSYAASILPNYQALINVLHQGEDVVAIVNMNQCQSEGKPGPNATMRINFNIFSHYEVPYQGVLVNTVATSNTILTEHRSFGPVYAYARLRVFPDNHAEVHTAYYDAKTMVLKDKKDYECQIGIEQPGVSSHTGIKLIKKS